MNDETIKAARWRCKLFTQALEDLNRAFAAKKGDTYLTDFPIQTGAIRRASMDLTRALANMRKPG